MSFKFIMTSLVYGAVWFTLFCIPVSAKYNLFTFLQHTLVLMFSDNPHAKLEHSGKIEPDKVIDAVTNAFQ